MVKKATKPLLKKLKYKLNQEVIVNFLGELIPCKIIAKEGNKDRRYYSAQSTVDRYKYVFIGENGSEKWANINDDDQSRVN